MRTRPASWALIGLLDLAPGRIRYCTTRLPLPSAPHRQGVQISPGRCANCRCTSTRIYCRLSPDTNSPVDCLCLAKGRASGSARPARRVPVCFAARCHRQQHPSALTMGFAVRRLATLARRLPSDDPSRFRPCLRLVVILAHDESKAVLPQGTFTP